MLLFICKMYPYHIHIHICLCRIHIWASYGVTPVEAPIDVAFGPIDGLRVVQLYIIGDLGGGEGEATRTVWEGVLGNQVIFGVGLIRPGFSVGSLKIKGVRKNPVWWRLIPNLTPVQTSRTYSCILDLHVWYDPNLRLTGETFENEPCKLLKRSCEEKVLVFEL